MWLRDGHLHPLSSNTVSYQSSFREKSRGRRNRLSVYDRTPTQTGGCSNRMNGLPPTMGFSNHHYQRWKNWEAQTSHCCCYCYFSLSFSEEVPWLCFSYFPLLPLSFCAFPFSFPSCPSPFSLVCSAGAVRGLQAAHVLL